MRVLWISVIVLFVDQLTKAAVLQYMYRHQSIALVGDWLRLTFTENPGMAFGIQIGPPGTVAVLALAATLLIGVYIWWVRDAYLPYRASLAFIFGGALGNIVDRIFYGVILGYGDVFTGKVVDFIHVSLWQGFVPDAIPVIGGAYVELFPIWNVADMSIVLGVAGVLFLYRGFHEEEMEALRRQHQEAAEQGGDPSGRAATAEASEDATDRAPAGSSTTDDPAPAVPEASARNGTSQDETVEPEGPRDSAPPEVPVYEGDESSAAPTEDTTDADDAQADAPDASQAGSANDRADQTPEEESGNEPEEPESESTGGDRGRAGSQGSSTSAS